MKGDCESGWVCLHRKIIDSMVFKNEGLLKVWIWCLAKANHESVWVSINTGKGLSAIEIHPGQFIFGRKSAAHELDMNESTLYKRMQILKKAKNVNIQSNSHFSIISIVNWDTYQDKNNKSNRQSNKQGTSKEQARNTNNNDNNDNNKKHIACFDLPEFINPETWNDFVEMRKKIKKPMTDRAAKSIVKQLSDFHKAGENVEQILENSIVNCWQGVFAPKKDLKTVLPQKQNDYSEFD